MGRKRLEKSINTIVIHCAATPNGKWVTTEDIDEWHAKRNFKRDMSIAPLHEPNLKHIGYHFVIYTNGAIGTGRPLTETGAHVEGHNQRSIGVVMAGTDKFALSAWDTLAGNVKSLRDYFKNKYNTVLKVTGHRDLSPDRDGDGIVEEHEWLKICPGFSVPSWLTNGMKPLKKHILDDGHIQCADDAANEYFYRVKSGDSLWAIAREHGLSIKALKRINNLTDDKILVGQRLAVKDVQIPR